MKVRKFIPKPVKKTLFAAAKTFRIVKDDVPPLEKAQLALEKKIDDYILEKFYDPACGKEYGLTRTDKTELLEKFKLVLKNVPTATRLINYVVMAREIFNIPEKQKGDIIECGSWKGGSSAILSLICEKVGRKLIVADSFEGIPGDDDKHGHFYPHLSVMGYYEKGMYEGKLDEVKQNISQYGDISRVEFIKGFYKESLKNFRHALVFAFLDVDLRSSLQDSVRYIWPNLRDGSLVYTDDSCDMDVVDFWFDKAWWKRYLKQDPPGYVGSGCGLAIGPEFSSLGYTRKVKNPEKTYKRENWHKS